MGIISLIYHFLRGFLVSSSRLTAENLALRQQLGVLLVSGKRPRLRKRDRIFWVWLSKLWKDWRSCLVIVQPDTVVRWHRQGFKLYWRWKSRNAGRPKVDPEIRKLIRRMSRGNPLRGAPRIQAELRLLGHDVVDSTVAKYLEPVRKGREAGPGSVKPLRGKHLRIWLYRRPAS